MLCVRWYLRYSLSYRNLEEMMAERGTHGRPLDHCSLGFALLARSREADPPRVAPAQSVLAC